MSSRTRASLEPAYVLHHYPYRDSSLLLEVFTRDHGRIGLVARGARSEKSRWRGQLQLFMPLTLSWSARGELGTLTGAESRGSGAIVSGRRLLSAYYLNELLLRMLTRNDPHADLFHAYEQALAALESAEEPALRLFEKRLLQGLGYGLLLDHDAHSGASIDAGGLYEYHLERGPVKCPAPRAGGLYLRGASLIALHQETLSDPLVCREVKQLMRAALALYLGPRPLKTREVLRQLSTLPAGAGESPLNAG